jgi:hypothetical protein
MTDKEREEFFAHISAGTDPLTAAAASGFDGETKPEPKAQSDEAHTMGVGTMLGLIVVIYAAFKVWAWLM